jgi:hypothetical protein
LFSTLFIFQNNNHHIIITTCFYTKMNKVILKYIKVIVFCNKNFSMYAKARFE